MASGNKALTIIVDDSKHCTPCKTRDARIESQYYCTDCEAYYCEQCFELHPRVPFLAKHIVLKHDDIAVWSNVPYKCTTHDKNLEFFCGEHKLLCCHVCVSLKHRSCDDIEYILESAKKIFAKEKVTTMIQLLQEKIDKVESYGNKIRDKTKINQNSKTEYIKVLEEFKSRLDEIFDGLIEKALGEMSKRFNKNAKYSEEVTKELNQIETQLLELKHQLSTATKGKEVLIYISLKRGENLVEDITRKLSKIDLTTNKENFRPVLDKTIEHFINNIKQIAHLEDLVDEQKRQESVLSEEFELRLRNNSDHHSSRLYLSDAGDNERRGKYEVVSEVCGKESTSREKYGKLETCGKESAPCDKYGKSETCNKESAAREKYEKSEACGEESAPHEKYEKSEACEKESASRETYRVNSVASENGLVSCQYSEGVEKKEKKELQEVSSKASNIRQDTISNICEKERVCNTGESPSCSRKNDLTATKTFKGRCARKKSRRLKEQQNYDICTECGEYIGPVGSTFCQECGALVQK